MVTIRENLVAAKALISAPNKWIKGSYQIGDCYCAYGALGMAECGVPNLFSDELADALRLGAPNGHPASFNDLPETTHADVMAMFDRAIAAQDVTP